MSASEDTAIGQQLAAACGFRDNTPLLKGDKARAILDGYLGKALARGQSVVMRWDGSQIPDFKVSSDEEVVDAQNRARYELYLQRLGKAGFNPADLQRRQMLGVRAKARIRSIKSKLVPSIKVHDRGGVQRRFNVVK